MQLPFLPNKKTMSSKTFLGLFLKEEEGIALILYEEDGKMAIKEKEHFKYSNGWEHIIQDIDDILFRLEQKLSLSLDQTIFFVYSHFIDEKANDIKKPYIQKIKELVKSLELKALGYIECSEAVLHFLEKKEEMPLTAILVELDKTNVGVFVYKGGKVAHKKVLSRTDNLIDDLLESFGDLKGKFLLPARLILYNSKDLDDESTKIVTYHWSEDYFIQLPRVEILKEDEVIEGLAGVFQEQMVKDKKIIEEAPVGKKETFGFVIGEDIQDKDRKENRPKGDRPLVEKPIFKIPVLPAFNFGIFTKLPKFDISKRVALIFGIVFIALGLLLNEIFLHKATLTVFLPYDSLSKKIDVQAVVGNDVMVSTSSATYTDSKQATGKRDIGEKAKGGLTLYNYDDKEKVFIKGTVLTASGLQFSLDNDVKVATASFAPDGIQKLPGKNIGGVTASDIGSEGNLSKGQRFKIDDLSSSIYFAINDAAFTGGTRKQIQTVSKQDTEDLETKLTAKAKNPQSNKSSTTNIKPGEEILPQLSEIKLHDLQFSKEVGEEGSEVSLKATADTIYFYFRKDILLNRLMSEMKPEVRNGFSLEKNKIHYKINSVERENNTITLNLSVNAKALKQVSKEEITAHVLGKNKSAVESALKKNYQAEGFEVTIKNPLPLLNTFLPFIKNNIQVVISSL